MDKVIDGCQAALDFSRLVWMRRRNMAGGGNAPSVLAFVPPGDSRRVLESVSSEAGWTLTISDTPPAAPAKGAEKLAPIILFDRELSPGNWREAVGVLIRRSPRPYLILLSPNSDGNLWDELQRVGGSDILRTPRRSGKRTAGSRKGVVALAQPAAGPVAIAQATVIAPTRRGKVSPRRLTCEICGLAAAGGRADLRELFPAERLPPRLRLSGDGGDREPGSRNRSRRLRN